jgi:hypothetical protein
MKKAFDTTARETHMKAVINLQAELILRKSIEAKMTMAMNVKVNMNQNVNGHAFVHEFHDECEQERQDEDEAQGDAVNGNEMSSNCSLPRLPNHSGGGARIRYPTRLPKSLRVEMKSSSLRK